MTSILLADNATSSRTGGISIVMALIHRSFIKSNRDVVAYGIRIVMYLGLAIMMGTVWLRLHTDQEYIQPFINAIVSFGNYFSQSFTATYPGSSFSARLSCHLWPSLMCPRISKIAQCLSKNEEMDFMEPRRSCSQIF